MKWKIINLKNSDKDNDKQFIKALELIKQKIVIKIMMSWFKNYILWKNKSLKVKNFKVTPQDIFYYNKNVLRIDVV